MAAACRSFDVWRPDVKIAVGHLEIVPRPGVALSVTMPPVGAYDERLRRTVDRHLRRDCFDHVIVMNQGYAQLLLGEFRDWYNQDRMDLALGKDTPDHPAIEPS
jgi:hypothetical protein